MKGAPIREFIDYKPQIGVEACHIYGFPGSGKSNLGSLLLSNCLEQGDCGLMRGDLFAEWRHFQANYKYPVKLLIPGSIKASDLTCIGFNLKEIDHEFVDTQDFNVVDHLEPERLLVLYDACYGLAGKGWFWAVVFEQLIQRDRLISTPVTYLDHEAGILFPEIALSESKDAQSHWRAVNAICEHFVFFRKALIRPILISQLETEINHRLRGKCLWNVIKQGAVSKGHPESVRQAAPRQRVHEFISSIGKEVFTRGNVSKKFKETKHVWKMLAHKLVHPFPDKLPVDHMSIKQYRDQIVDKLITIGKLTQGEIGGVVGLSQQSISKKAHYQQQRQRLHS